MFTALKDKILPCKEDLYSSTPFDVNAMVAELGISAACLGEITLRNFRVTPCMLIETVLVDIVSTSLKAPNAKKTYLTQLAISPLLIVASLFMIKHLCFLPSFFTSSFYLHYFIESNLCECCIFEPRYGVNELAVPLNSYINRIDTTIHSTYD